jgi:hypothetical protein
VRFYYQTPEIRVQFRGAASDIDRNDCGTVNQQPYTSVCHSRRHDLLTLRASVDVTMVTGLVAQLADIYL